MRSIVAIGAFCLALGTAHAQQNQAPIKTQEPGRYQIVFSPITTRAIFLLDTQTGRAWQLTAYTDLNGEPLAWKLMFRLDTLADQETFVSQFGFKPRNKSAPAVPSRTPLVGMPLELRH
jgi:hypothetical protein